MKGDGEVEKVVKTKYSKVKIIFLANKTAAILYLTDSENYGRDSVASQVISSFIACLKYYFTLKTV